MNNPFTYFIILLMLFCREAKTQTNLVPNGSFEDTLTCPYSQGQVSFANHWNEYASADYYNSCASSLLFSTPFNWAGYQSPKDGNAYVGLNTYANYVIDGREYIYCKLNSKLTVGKKYYVSFYVCCSKSNYISASRYTNNLGSRFTTFIPNNSQAVNYSHINSTNLISDTVNWTKIEGTFIADSSYEYISIGNFYNDSNTQVGNFFSNIQNIAYYFVDDVFVNEVGLFQNNSDINIPNIFTPNSDEVNDVWRCNFSAFETVNCSIYNRWGNLIFQSNKQIIQWDGRTTSGEPCSDGVYFYVIQSDEEQRKGHIQLVR